MIRQSLLWATILMVVAEICSAQEPSRDTIAQGVKVSAVMLFAEFREGDTGAWRELRLGQKLPPGSHVRTLKRSSLEARFADGSYIRLSPESVILLQQDDRHIVLVQGSVYGDYRNSGQVQVPAQEMVVKIPRNRFLVGTEDATQRPPLIFSGVGATTILSGTSTPLSASPDSEQFPYGEKGPFYQQFPTGIRTSAIPETRRETVEYISTENMIQTTISHPLTPIVPTVEQPLPLPLRPVMDPPDPPVLSGESHSRSVTSPRPGHFGPEFDGSAFAFQSNDSTLAGAYLREYGTTGGHLWEVAVTPVELFGGDDDVSLTDANVRLNLRSMGGFTLGRQRFLTGTVLNTRIGTLVRQGGRDIQDAITWQPILTDPRMSLQLSCLVDAFPSGLPTAVSGLQWGWYSRLGYKMNVGQYGLNLTHNELGDQVGATLDFSVPVLRRHIELYGEVGKDTFSRDIVTVGFYFPRLYQKYDVDLFLEYSDVGDFGLPFTTEYLVRAYYPLNKRVYFFSAVDGRSRDSTEYGLGLMVRLIGSR